MDTNSACADLAIRTRALSGLLTVQPRPLTRTLCQALPPAWSAIVSEQIAGGEHLPCGDRIDAAPLPHCGRQNIERRGLQSNNEQREAQQAEQSEPCRYAAVPRPNDVPNDRRSSQDGRVASEDRKHRAGGVHPAGSVGLRDGSAVNGCDQKVTDCIRGSESEKQYSLVGFESPDDEDGAGEKQSSLQVERGVHQGGQQGVDHAAVKHAARGDSEITDEIVRVAVIGSKARGRNGFEDQITKPCGNPHSGSTRDQ